MRFINHNCGFNNRLNLFVWNHIGFPPCLFSKHFDATSYLKALFLCWKGDWFGFIIRGRCLPWAFLSPSNHQETSSPSTLKPESRLFIFIIEIRLCSRCNVVRWLRQHPIINQGPLVSSPTLLAFLSIFKNALYLWLPLNTRWEIFSGGNINGVCVCVAWTGWIFRKLLLLPNKDIFSVRWPCQSWRSSEDLTTKMWGKKANLLFLPVFLSELQRGQGAISCTGGKCDAGGHHPPRHV